jgi:hypothetical protein
MANTSLAATLLFGTSQVSIFNTVQNYYVDSFEKYTAVRTSSRRLLAFQSRRSRLTLHPESIRQAWVWVGAQHIRLPQPYPDASASTVLLLRREAKIEICDWPLTEEPYMHLFEKHFASYPCSRGQGPGNETSQTSSRISLSCGVGSRVTSEEYGYFNTLLPLPSTNLVSKR